MEAKLAQVDDLPIEPHPFVTGDRVVVNQPIAKAIHGRTGMIDSFRGALHVAGAPARETLARVLLDGHSQHTVISVKHLRKEGE